MKSFQYLKNIFRISKPPQSPIPVYHNVAEGSSNPLVSNNIHNITPDNFCQQLLALKRTYEIVFIDELVDLVQKKKDIKGICSITFDDGYRSVIDIAYPIMKELKIPATLFVTGSLVEKGVFWRDKVRYIVNQNLAPDFLDFARKEDEKFTQLDPNDFYLGSKSPNIMNSRLVEQKLDQYFEHRRIPIQQLSNDLYLSPKDLSRKYDYLRFGNHTYNHYVLSSLRKEEQREEMITSQQFLTNLGVEVSNVFAIPFGGLKTFNSDSLDLLMELGFDAYLTCSSRKLSSALDHLGPLRKTKLIGLTRYLPENTGEHRSIA